MQKAAQPMQKVTLFQLAVRHGVGGFGEVSIARDLILG
jgi:hypothetical protein